MIQHPPVPQTVVTLTRNVHSKQHTDCSMHQGQQKQTFNFTLRILCIGKMTF